MGHKKVAGILFAAIAGLSMQAAFAAGPKPQFVFIDQPVTLGVSAPDVFAAPGLPPPPAGTGVLAYMQSNLLDKNGRLVGKQYSTCSTVTGIGSVGDETPGEQRMCHQTMIINGLGRLQLSGVVSTELLHQFIPQPLSIVGGTGVFQNARGQVLTSEPIEHVHGFDVYLWPF